MRINSGHMMFWPIKGGFNKAMGYSSWVTERTISMWLRAALLSLFFGLTGCAQLAEMTDAEPQPTEATTDSSSDDMATEESAPPAATGEVATGDDIDVESVDSESVDVEGEPLAGETVTPPEEVPPPSINPYLASEPVLSSMVRAKFDSALAKAKAAQSDAEVVAAITAFEAVLAEQADLSGARMNLAQLYRRQGQTDTAMTQLKQAVIDNPNNLDAWNLLGVLQREQGDFLAAEQSYLQALKRWNDYAPAHRNIGILYELYMGRFNDALTHYEAYQALQEKPERRVKGWILLLQRRIDAGEGVDSAVVSEPDVAGEGA